MAREDGPTDLVYRPDGYNSVSTYIVADQAQRVVDFLIEGFGAKQLRRFDVPDGSIMHAEVQIDETVVMIADGGEGHPAFPIWLHGYVSDVDACYERLLKIGGTSVQEPMQKQNDPDRRAGIKDPAGNTWWIATQLS
jgi:uncharacterized glyoxalase superfamily protein PhnB